MDDYGTLLVSIQCIAFQGFTVISKTKVIARIRCLRADAEKMAQEHRRRCAQVNHSDDYIYEWQQARELI